MNTNKRKLSDENFSPSKHFHAMHQFDQSLPTELIHMVAKKMKNVQPLMECNTNLQGMLLPVISRFTLNVTRNSRVPLLANVKIFGSIKNLKVVVQDVFDVSSWLPIIGQIFSNVAKLTIKVKLTKPVDVGFDNMDIAYSVWKTLCSTPWENLEALSINVPIPDWGKSPDVFQQYCLQYEELILDAPRLQYLKFPFTWIARVKTGSLHTISGQSIEDGILVSLIDNVNSGLETRILRTSAKLEMITTDNMLLSKNLIIKLAYPSQLWFVVRGICNVQSIDFETSSLPYATNTFSGTQVSLLVDSFKIPSLRNLTFTFKPPKAFSASMMKMNYWIKYIALLGTAYIHSDQEMRIKFATKSNSIAIEVNILPNEDPKNQIIDEQVPNFSTIQSSFTAKATMDDSTIGIYDETVYAVQCFLAFLANEVMSNFVESDMFNDAITCETLTINKSVNLNRFVSLLESILEGGTVHFRSCTTLHLNIDEDQKRDVLKIATFAKPTSLFINGIKFEG